MEVRFNNVGELSPFSQDEARQARHAAECIIYREQAVTDFDVKAVLRFGGLVRTFLTYCDREHGALRVTMYSGGALDQPAKTMEAVRIIQQVFCEKLKLENEKMKMTIGR